MQRKKESLMQYASRSASAAEQQHVLDDVAAVQADRNQADGLLQVTHLKPSCKALHTDGVRDFGYASRLR